MKNRLWLLLAAAFCIAVFAEEEPQDLGKLRKERAELAQEMHKKRLDLIEKEPELKALHDKVIALHKELALQLDKHRDMAPLVKKARQLDAEISRLEEEKKKDDAGVKREKGKEE